jgi:hypothetical protein
VAQPVVALEHAIDDRNARGLGAAGRDEDALEQLERARGAAHVLDRAGGERWIGVAERDLARAHHERALPDRAEVVVERRRPGE